MYKKERIYYFDILKALAIFGVVFIHVFALGNMSQVKGITIVNFKEIFEFAVPVFLMVTGALLLNRDYESIPSFLKKRFKRIIPPYLFWIIFIIFALVYPSLINHRAIHISTIYTNFFMFPLTWYFWLMISAYLMIPIINAFIKSDSENGPKYLVIMFILSSVFYQFLISVKSYTFMELRFFLMPIGYLSLGYLLANYDFKRKNLVLIVSVLLFAITSAIKVIYGQSPEVTLIFANIPLGQASFIDVGIVKIIQACSVFLIIKYLPLKLSKIKKIITSISRSSYGIYLVHIFVFLLIFNYTPVQGSGTHVFLTLLIGTFVVFILSWIIVLIASKIPYINKLSGYA